MDTSRDHRPPRARLLRVALGVALGAAVIGGLLSPGALRLDGAGAASVASLAVTGVAFAADTARTRARLSLVGGVLASALFALDLRVFAGTFAASVFGGGVVACVPRWGGAAGGAVRRAREAILWLGGALVVPAFFAAAASATGNGATLAHDLLRALPSRPLGVGAVLALEVLVVLLATDALASPLDSALDSSQARGLATRRALTGVRAACAALAAAALALRVVFVGALATLPTEVYWPEAPFLVNALKLDAGAKLYGAPEALDSYTYSPLLDIVHHAALSPFGAELSLHASRAIVLVEELAAIVILVVTLAPRALHVRTMLFASIVALAVLANPLAPAVHPDHPLLLAFAVAVALLARDKPVRGALWFGALVLVPPIAVAFKLSGAGIGVGLFAVFALERRWREVLALSAAGALSIATVPLFDATLGSFSFYAIRVQASHPIVWSRLYELPLTPAGFAAIFAAILAFVALRRSHDDVPGARLVRRLVILTASVSAASLPAYLKYGGRENNLALLLVGATLIALVSPPAPRVRAELAPAGALLAVLLFQPIAGLGFLSERGAAIADDARVVAAIRADDAAGRHTLDLTSTAAWIAAGHRDVPHDRFHSAVELFFGGHPEADAFFAHVEDGRYDTVIATSAELRDGGDLLGRFDARLRRALQGYTLAWPNDGRSAEAADGVVIFVRDPAARR